MMQKCYDEVMRTTVDIPEDIHRQAMSLARDTARTFSETVTDLLRRALRGEGAASELSYSERTGLPVISLGRLITTDDVRSLEDDE